MKKVLLVNDCRFESAVMKDKLAKLNYEVRVSDELSAVEETLSYHPDMVIANLIMKSTQGDALLSEIKKVDKSIVCILSSCSPVKKEQFNSGCVDEVINTPINDNNFKIIMESCTGIKKRQASYAFCPFCGKSLGNEKESIRFCPFCGHRLEIKVD